MKKLYSLKKIQKIQQQLDATIVKELQADGMSSWIEVDSIRVMPLFNMMMLFSIRYGFQKDEKVMNQEEKEIIIADGNVDFIVGQIIGYIKNHD